MVFSVTKFETPDHLCDHFLDPLSFLDHFLYQISDPFLPFVSQFLDILFISVTIFEAFTRILQKLFLTFSVLDLIILIQLSNIGKSDNLTKGVLHYWSRYKNDLWVQLWIMLYSKNRLTHFLN